MKEFHCEVKIQGECLKYHCRRKPKPVQDFRADFPCSLYFSFKVGSIV